MIELLPPYVPLVNAGALSFFEEIIRPGFAVFEFGSGRSTIWFAQNCCEVVSVEHGPEWFAAVSTKLAELGLAVDLRFIDCAPSDGMHNYVKVITGYPDDYFDLVFVDGQARPWCIRDARCKVKPGGWMVCDDTHYHPVKTALPLLDGWTCRQFRGVVHGAIDGYPRTNTTGFFQKPGGRDEH